MIPELSATEARVLGALIEKHMTTPDHYPLTTTSLRAACNQSSNRDPVVAYDEDTIIDAVNGLRAKDLARTVKRSGERAIKHLESADEGLEIDRRQKALLAILLLRGPQTAAELRSRTERYCSFADLADVESAMHAMETADNPVARLLARQPGQKEPRYAHLLVGGHPLGAGGSADEGGFGGGDEVEAVDEPLRAAPPPARQNLSEVAALRSDVATLTEEVAALRSELADLKALIED